jgi:bifunctional UDP-N-acetylglucosamine pyrophosphorylase / glucosamine-1-phosphate N-acetyltransferase
MILGAVVLAAGLGTRMGSRRPKVMHRLAGRPMLAWVLDALAGAGAGHTVVVIGRGAEEVAACLPPGVSTALQEEQLGTGHAAQVGLAALEPRCDAVLIVNGDLPLMTAELVRALVDEHARGGRAATLLTARLDDPGPYGRVVRGADGLVERVVEARDADPGELAIDEVNGGLYVFSRSALEEALAGLGRDNAQGEVYLPDALARLAPAAALAAPDPAATLGVNTRVELAVCERLLQDRLRRELMLGGVTLPDPAGVYLEAGVQVGEDTVIWPGTHLRGATEIGAGCEIGPDVVISDSSVGAGSTVVSAHLLGSEVGEGCRVGPFAYLRPGCRLEDGSRAGTYVELKNTSLGRDARVPHLSYVGDATVGEDTNIGAGNITANYDGFRKHRTEIGARVKTGSDCVFVAPVRVGDGAMTGAGSIITHDVPDGALGIARARQTVVEGYAEKAAARAAARRPDGGSG